MDVEYYYCNHCGYEDYNLFVPYIRSVANGDLCICPICGAENFAEEKDE